jgi:predicted nucleic acid-binding protein
MTRFVIDPDVAIEIAARNLVVGADHQLLAPTLLRSEVLARLYAAVRAGTLSRKQAEARLDRIRALGLRLLGDRVLQRVAWQIAEARGWPDTYKAEYVALTRLQADAFVTLDEDLAREAAAVVTVARIDALGAGIA